VFGPAPASTTGAATTCGAAGCAKLEHAASTGDDVAADVDHADVGHLERNTTGAAGSTDPAGRRWVEYSCTYPESSLLGEVHQVRAEARDHCQRATGHPYTAMTRAFGSPLVRPSTAPPATTCPHAI